MGKQAKAGQYRAGWDIMPVLRVFLEAIRPGETAQDDDEDDEDPVKRAMKRARDILAGVRTSLRDAVDPGLVLAVDEDTSAVRDAIEELLFTYPSRRVPEGGEVGLVLAVDEGASASNDAGADLHFSVPRCEALASLLDAARHVREGREAGVPDTPAGLAVQACIGQHGGDHCSPVRFLLALFHDCRREGRGHCLGVPLLAGGGAACQDYPRLDDAARRCLALNGLRCHAADDLDEPDPEEAGREGEGAGVAAEEEKEPEKDASEGGGAGGDSSELDAEDAASAEPAETVMAAVWGWARRYNLVADQATLRRIAAEFGDDPLLPEMAYHKSVLLVAYRTLRAWASSPEARAELSWHRPEDDKVEFDDEALGLFHGLPDHVSHGEDGTEGEFVCRQRDSREADPLQGDHRRYEIVFRPLKWDPFEETPAEAAGRIAKSFRRHLARMLAAHHEVVRGPADKDDRAREVGDVVKAGATLNPRHARWLVLHQVCGLPFSTIGEADPLYKDREPSKLSTIVGREVRDAAELLLGPRYELWLRPSSAGRPPGSANKPQL